MMTGRSLPSKRKGLAPSQKPKSTYWSQPAVYIVGVVAVFLVVIFRTFNAPSPTPPTVQPTQEAAPPVPPPTTTSTAMQRVFPALQITSSGRIPTSLRGFSLGMTFTAAVQLHPGLENAQGAGPPSLRPTGDAWVVEKGPGGIYDQVTFANGRAVDVSSELDYLHADDASKVQETTFGQLGAPTIEIDERDRSYPARRWVWTDGDVRIAYEEWTRANGSRYISIHLIDYPELLKALETPDPSGNQEQQLALVQIQKAEWGDKPKPDPYVSTQLPDTMEGLKLGQPQSETIATLPPGAWENNLEPFWYKLANGNRLELRLYHRNLLGICEFHHEIGPDRFDQFRENLSAEYGPANIHGVIGKETGWNNGKVKLTYNINEGDDVGHPFMVVCTEDANIDWEISEENATPPQHYNPAPPDFSVFLTQDLSHSSDSK